MNMQSSASHVAPVCKGEEVATVSAVTLSKIVNASEDFRTAVGRLWWHTDDAYLQGILSQCVLTLGDHAETLRAETSYLARAGRESECGEPQSASDACFEVQENTAALTRCVLELGRGLLAHYAAAQDSSVSGFVRDALREQQHELDDMLALIETTACWLTRKALLVDVALDDWLMAQPRRDAHRLALPC